jgi:CRP/FNR family transcriptional regulator, cyclic AMP receptor protein
MDQKLEMLAKVPLLAHLNKHDLEQVSRVCDEVDLPAGRTVTKQGDWGEEFFVIVDGAVTVDRDGKHLRDLGAGDFFGELALLSKIPRTATVTCTTPSRFLVLGHREFNGLLASYPSIQTAVLHALATRVAVLEPEAPH